MIHIVRNKQSVFDLAIQFYGSPEQVFQLLAENPQLVDVSGDIAPGTRLTITPAVSQQINFIQSTGRQIITGRPKVSDVYRITEAGEIRILEDGNTNRIIE